MYPFEGNPSICITGMTGCGKSYLVYRILSEKEDMFKNVPPKVLYCYAIYQELFREMEKTLPFLEFYEGLPNVDLLNNLPENSLIVLDDLGSKLVASSDVSDTLTMRTHHKKISIIYITHNLFMRSKHSKTIANNTHFLILMKNPRAVSQVACLARQIYPTKSKALIEAYQDCMKKKYGYLVIDLSPYGEQEHMLRTDIFKNEDTVVYNLL